MLRRVDGRTSRSPVAVPAPRLKPHNVSWLEWTRPEWERSAIRYVDGERQIDQLPFANKLWRLNNLYHIVDAKGRRTLFRMKPRMFDVLMEEHWRNVLLKARQYGFTTEFALDQLDDCLFTANCQAQMTFHERKAAEAAYLGKVRYAYEHLGEIPDEEEPHADLTREEWLAIATDIRATVPPTKMTEEQMWFANGSSIRCTTSGRSGTVQRLHVSELGKMSAVYPKKAVEVRTGSLPAAKNGVVWYESTAEGDEGEFADACKQAMELHEKGVPLTRNDFKFHFFPWWEDPDYQLTTAEALTVPINSRTRAYFEKLEGEHQVKLTREQMAWYIVEERTQGASMKKEYPSYPQEAFELVIEGAYFAEELRAARLDGRIGLVSPIDTIAVDTWWDIGINDMTAIWFSQQVGNEDWFIDYYENQGVGLKHYKQVLDDKREEFGWIWGRHVGPHDIKTRDWVTSDERYKIAEEMGITFDQSPKPARKMDGIDASRAVFGTCRFDEANCDQGIKRLGAYRKEWDEMRGVWKDFPYHDRNSDAADAFQSFSMWRRGKHSRGRRNVRARPVRRGRPRSIS